MARKGAHSEEQYDYIILDLLPYDKPGLRWEQIWSGAKQRGIGSSETISNHLKKLIDSHIVLHDGRYYRRNPTYQLRLEWIKNEGDGGKFRRVHVKKHEGAENLWHYVRKSGLQKAVSWDYPYQLSIKDEKEVIRYFEQLFSSIIYEYLYDLAQIVKISDKLVAREYLDLAIKAGGIQPMLMGLGYCVWKNRSEIKFERLVGLDQETLFPKGFRLARIALPGSMKRLSFQEVLRKTLSSSTN